MMWIANPDLTSPIVSGRMDGGDRVFHTESSSRAKSEASFSLLWVHVILQ
jgi:hypothetical protein